HIEIPVPARHDAQRPVAELVENHARLMPAGRDVAQPHVALGEDFFDALDFELVGCALVVVQHHLGVLEEVAPAIDRFTDLRDQFLGRKVLGEIEDDTVTGTPNPQLEAVGAFNLLYHGEYPFRPYELSTNESKRPRHALPLSSRGCSAYTR